MNDYHQNERKLEPQPSEKASLLSKLFFCWAPPLFVKSFQKNVTEKYYLPLQSHKAKSLGDKFEKVWKSVQPNLWLVIWKVFWVEFLILGFVFIFSEFVLKLSQPWLIGKLMDYLVLKESNHGTWLYGFLIVLSSFLSVLVSHFYLLHVQHLGTKIRLGCCTLIYRKILEMNKNAVFASNNSIINLVTNDANRFNLAAMHLIQLTIAPIETIVIVYCVYATAGTTALAGALLLILFIPFQMFLGKLSSSFRQQTAARTDERVKLMNEILTGIQVIKMFTWEELFQKLVTKARKLEISKILKSSFIKAFNSSFMLFMNRTGIYLCAVAYALTYNEINAKYVFVVASFYAVLRQNVTVHLPFGIQNFGETKTSIWRIKQFLLNEDTVHETKTYYIEDVKDAEKTTKPRVLLTNMSSKWSDSSNFILEKINFEANHNDLVIITGPVGSGKSTLLYSLLDEVPHKQGDVHISGKISYASQEPWLFFGTIRQNILFGAEYNVDKYQKIVQICQLEQDFLNFSSGDETFIGNRGTMLSGGQKARISLARAVYREADIYLLDDPLAALDATVAQRIFQDCIVNYLKDRCRILVSNNFSLLSAADKIYMLNSGVLQEENFQQIDARQETILEPSPTVAKNKSQPLTSQKKHPPKAIYRKYVKAGGSFLATSTLAVLFVLTQLAASGADYFVAFWIDVTKTNNGYFLHTCIYIYTSIIGAIIFLSVTRSIFFFHYCVKASTNLHRKMFARIIKAPIAFFQTVSTGTILNRFSKDIGYIDESLSVLLMDAIQVTFLVLGSIVIIIFINPLMLIPTVIMLILFHCMKKLFLYRSPNIKRFEAEARSPVYSHIQATIQGLPSIRAYKIQELLKDEFDHYQDLHTSAFYMFMTCNRAFGFWLDMICVFYAGFVIITTVIADGLASDIGLSITQSTNLIGLIQWGIRQWSEVENQMINVERIIEYTEIDQESDGGELSPKNWPSNGEIKFHNVSLQYSNNLDYFALDNVSFSINPKEKIAVVGRTGAGKSSIISALFRLFDTKGRITIDGIDIKQISLNLLRSQISIIPQEPILFTGSLRTNLDPCQSFQDEALWKVLEQVELKNSITDLESEVLEGGCNLSVGQKQLICLARAILKRNKIVVMDEATANIDGQTTASIRNTISKHFKDCTVINVAHQFGNIMDADRVIVMENGKVVEFNKPKSLLADEGSVFAQLVKETVS